MTKSRWLSTVVAPTVLLAWTSAFVGAVSYLAAPVFLAALTWLVHQRRWQALSVLLVASPFSVAAASAALSYAHGTARLRTVGYPDVDLANVSSKTRFQTVSTGCLVDGSEWVLQLPNNLTLVMLHAIFGPMPGAYDGPYPLPTEIRSALSSVSRLDWRDLERDRVTVGDKRFALRPGLGSSLAAALRHRTSDAPCCTPSVALWHDRVLLVQLHSPLAELQQEEPFVVLIDVTSGKVIAYEGNEQLHSRALPKPWT